MPIHYLSFARLTPLFAASLVACGGGGSGGGPTEPAPPVVASRVTVEVVAGPTRLANTLATESVPGCDGLAANVFVSADAPIALGGDGKSIFIGAGCDSQPSVRKLDLDTKIVSTVARGGTLPTGSGSFTLTNFLSANAVAQTSDGSLLIGDSEGFTGGLTLSVRNKEGLGNGVWLLSPSGQLKQLAGFSQPARSAAADGVGPTAVFGIITAICPGGDDSFYVHGGGNIRKLTLDGTVSTLRGTDGAAVTGMVCGASGRNLVTNGQGQLQEIPSQRTFAPLDGKVGSIYGLADEPTAWVSDPARSTLLLINLSTGTALEGSSLGLGEPTQLSSAPYTLPPLSSFNFRTAPGQVAYAATAYSIVKLTYK